MKKILLSLIIISAISTQQIQAINYKKIGWGIGATAGTTGVIYSAGVSISMFLITRFAKVRSKTDLRIFMLRNMAITSTALIAAYGCYSQYKLS